MIRFLPILLLTAAARAAVVTSFDEASLNPAVSLDIPAAASATVAFDDVNDELDFSAFAATDMWAARANAPIAWTAIPAGLVTGGSWVAETEVRINDATTGTQVAGLTFYGGTDGTRPDVTFGLDVWDANNRAVRLQGLGDNNPNAATSVAATVDRVFLRMVVSENGATDTYNFYFKINAGDAWTQVGGTALNYASSFANSRVGLTYKTGAAKAGAAFTYFSVIDTSGPPVILSHPANVSVVEPGGTSFSVTATGAASYQWRRNSAQISGATAATYLLPGTTVADNGALFSCAVTNVFGTTVSNEATLTVAGPSPATACYRSAVQAEPSLIAYFPMDGVTTTAVPNIITPANGGTVSGTLAWDATIGRIVGTQAHLGNRNSHINLTKDSRWDFTDGTGTLETWLYQSGTAADSPCFFAVRSTAATRYSLHTHPTGDMIQLWNGSAVTQWPVTPSLIGRLVHVAVVFEGGGAATCYLNGASLGTKTGALVGAAGLPAQIAASTSTGGERTQGNTDEVAIYSDALPAAAIAAHYASFIPGGNGTVASLVTQPAGQTVGDGSSVTFTVALSDTNGASYRWQRNGVDIAGATGASYTIPNAQLADNGAQFRCIAYNQCGGVLSNAATLIVTDDPANVVSVQQVGSGMLLVTFTESVNLTSGTWTLNNGATVTGLQPGPSANSVFALTSSLTAGTVYTLTITGVQDATGNPLAAPHVTNFTGSSFSGTPAPVDLVRGGREPIGPASRRGGIVISEINYHPADRPDLKNLEFVEVCNTLPWTEDLGGFQLTGEISYTFPPGTSIPAGGCLVVAAVPADVQAVHSLSGVLGPYTGALNNAGGRLRLRDYSDAVLFEVNYDSGPPWQPAADGAGHSLILARPSYGMDNPAAWDRSYDPGGSPGSADPFPADPYRTVVINEVWAEGAGDYVELFNYSSTAVDISGCSLSDDRDLAKYVIPASTSLSAGGFLRLEQAQLGFGFKAGGDTVYFRAPGSPGRVLDAVRFGPQTEGFPWGRTPDGSNSWWWIEDDPVGPNAAPEPPFVAISEIFYNPPPGSAQLPFVEITNSTGLTLDVSGWRLSGGVSYTIPAGTSMAHGTALVINAFTGSLNKGTGERVRLEKPAADPDGTGTVWSLVDEVTYGTGGRWGRDSDGGGSSLERRDLRASGNLASNWADSDESAEAGWVTIERTGIADNGQGTANRLEVYLLGAGEALVDDVELIRATTTTNIVNNPGFESGMTNWVANGTHLDSSVQAGAGVTGAALRLRATGRGDLAGNKTMNTLTTTATTGQTYTLRAKVKYLRGHPEIVLRLHGGYLEATGNILGTIVCGTPGAANSRATANAGPDISGVTHRPVLPQAGESATVYARVLDQDGTGAVLLNYRVDPSTAVTSVLMQPRGAGLFSGEIPARAAGTVAAFTITALDNLAVASVFPGSGEGLIRWGETQPAGNSITSYRLWLTQNTVNTWSNRLKNSNAPLDGTFVAGDYRVIYNAGAMYSGSPFHTGGFNSPVGNACDYNVTVPADDCFLGETDMIWAGPGTFGSDPSQVREQAAWWIARRMGSPSTHRRFVNVFVNGVRRGQIMEDAQQPNGEFLDEYYPGDSDGPLYKAQDWIEYNDDHAGFQSLSRAVLARALSGGQHKTSTYRYRWALRASSSGNDYAPLHALIDGFNAGTSASDPAFVNALDPLVDQDSWGRALAMQRIVGNWDTWGWSYGKNMYAYKPLNGQWQMFPWDMDFGFGPDGSSNPAPDVATAGLFQNTSNYDGGAPGDPLATKFRTQPAFRRAYWCALLDAASGPMVPATFNARMDLLAAALTANGITVNATQLAQVKTYVSDRRNYIIGQANAVYGAVTFGNAGGSTLTDDDGILTLTGTAPAGVKTFLINGVEYTPVWTSETAWSLPLTLYSAINNLTVQGLGYSGQLIGSFNVTINVTGPPQLPPVTVNEWMADNTSDSGFADPADGQYEDWFELHNAGASPVNLGGFYLTDTTTNVNQFQIPAGTTIPSGGWLLVWADNEPLQNGITPGHLHTNFRLSSAGEQLALYTPDGTLVDLITFGAQTANQSEGRYPDGTSGIVAPVPTPGKRNALPPDIIAILDAGAGVSQVTFSTEPTHIYQLESTTDLGTWTNWGAPVTAAGTVTSVNLPRSDTRRYWRATLKP